MKNHQGELIRSYLKVVGVSLTHVAMHANLSRSTLYKILKQSVVERHILNRLHRLFNHDPRWAHIYGEVEESRRQYLSRLEANLRTACINQEKKNERIRTFIATLS